MRNILENLPLAHFLNSEFKKQIFSLRSTAHCCYKFYRRLVCYTTTNKVKLYDEIDKVKTIIRLNKILDSFRKRKIYVLQITFYKYNKFTYIIIANIILHFNTSTLLTW